MTAIKRSSLHLAACLLFHPFLANAQSQTTGSIAGVVKDPAGAVVAGAEVTAKNNATGEERKTVTNKMGSYAVPLLPPGVYTVTVAANGFENAVFPDLRVAITETTVSYTHLTLPTICSV